MLTNLIGYLTQSAGKKDHVSLNIPVFNRDGGQFIQNIDPFTNQITGVTEVKGLNIVQFQDDRSYTISPGNDAVFLISFNDEVSVGTKAETDRTIISLIEQYDLPAMNLFSLYTFLGIPSKIKMAAESIIAQYSQLNLTLENFVIPAAVSINDARVPSIIHNILDKYSNILYTFTDLAYPELVQFPGPGEEVFPDEVYIGLSSFKWAQIEASLPQLLHPDPQLPAEIRVNDFTIALLVSGKKPLPSKVRICQFFPTELMQDPELMSDDINESLSELQRRSSSNYYRFRPRAETAQESAVIISRRVSKDIEGNSDPVKEMPQQESEEFDAIQNHIVQTHQLTNA